MEALYDGVRSKDGKSIFPGYAVGGEADAGGWSVWITGAKVGHGLAFAFANGYFSNMVFQSNAGGEAKPNFDIKAQSLDQAYEAAKLRTAADLNATDPNLKPFLALGGKLILYHGWNDPAISPFSTIDYYDRALAATGKEATEASVRLYMVPGMGHCEGGAGPDSFGQFGWLPSHGADDPKRDAYLALEQWREGGMAPQEIIATKYAGEDGSGAVKRTRPLCPYPQVARYMGTGDTDRAGAFACSAKTQ